MALCDQLEENISSAKDYSNKLMQAVLQEAFNTGKPKQEKVISFPTQQCDDIEEQFMNEEQYIAARTEGNAKISSSTKDKIPERKQLMKARKQ